MTGHRHRAYRLSMKNLVQKLQFFILATILLSIAQANARLNDWELVPIAPVCSSGLFCTKDEMAREIKQAGVAERLVKMAERTLKQDGRLSMAFMSFNEPGLFKQLCRLTKQGLRVDGFFDSKAGPPQGMGHKLETECQAGNKHNVRMFYMGMAANNKKNWRLHHNKFYLTETGDRAEMAFGSANLTATGLGVDFENWNFVKGPRTEPFLADHICDAQAMRVAREKGTTEDNPEIFRSELEKCLSQKKIAPAEVDRVMTEQGAWAFFSPDARNRTFKILESQIDQVNPKGRIRVATYYFTHEPLVLALKRAQKRGVQVELLIDDDLINEKGGSIPGQRKFYQKYLKPEASGFQVRAFDTNESIFQLQHNKFLILESVGKRELTRVFAGAGQFTKSAFEKNYENFYLLENPEIVKQFEKLFDDLWKRGREVKPAD